MFIVGAAGFEPTTLPTRTARASRAAPRPDYVQQYTIYEAQTQEAMLVVSDWLWVVGDTLFLQVLGTDKKVKRSAFLDSDARLYPK